MAPVRRQAITWTNADFLSIAPPGTNFSEHYNDVIMAAMASQITSITIVYSTVYSDTDQKKTSKLRVTGLCEGNSPVTGEFPSQMASNAKKLPIDDVIMILIKVQHFSLMRSHLKRSSAKWLPFCPGGDELNSRFLPWHWGDLTIASMPAKQPWRIWMKSTDTKPKQNTTKHEPFAYTLGSTASLTVNSRKTLRTPFINRAPFY